MGWQKADFDAVLSVGWVLQRSLVKKILMERLKVSGK